MKGTSDELYEMIMELYKDAMAGRHSFVVNLEILPTFDSELLSVFIDLVQEAIDEFGITVDFEVIDYAGIFE